MSWGRNASPMEHHIFSDNAVVGSRGWSSTAALKSLHCVLAGPFGSNGGMTVYIYIEKLWGTLFYTITYGKEFTLETDQKPLVSIYKKHMIDINPRVQRLIVRSFPYLPFKLVYKKVVDIPVADALSRVTSMDPEDNIKFPIIAVNMITAQVLMSTGSQGSISNKLQCLKESTSQDEWHKGYISTGFPCDKKNLLTDLHEFWLHKKMLSIKLGLITCRTSILVSREMRPELLQHIHEGHQGKEHCLLSAKNILAQDHL